MAKDKTIYSCIECGYESSRWMGKCPECLNWNTFVEEKINAKVEKSKKNAVKTVATTINNIKNEDEERYETNIKELDRVLGGGIVDGSLILLGGAPGIGKSTLILQICKKMLEKNVDILYVSGEESEKQIKLRADRLGVVDEQLYILSETDIYSIENNVDQIKPKLLIIDSIQTMYNSDLGTIPGSVGQVREATNTFMKIAKEKNIPTIIVGHVTKEGSIAGPRVLEHMVDTVLYFESTKDARYRIIRTIKNRFGSTNEIGLFEMTNEGLLEIENPSKVMLEGKPEKSTGSVITASMEGTRAVLVEVQALVTYTKMNIPRRTAIGYDNNRLSMLIAVIEKHLGANLSQYDVFLNIAGNIKINDSALDLPIIAAILSSFKNKIIDDDMIVIGEVGLSGEVRTVNEIEKRLNEASKLGFKKYIIPFEKNSKVSKGEGFEMDLVKSIKEIGKYF